MQLIIRGILLVLLLFMPSLALPTFLDDDSSNVYIGLSFMQSLGFISYDKYTDSFLNQKTKKDEAFYPQRFDFTAGYRLTKNFRAEGQFLLLTNSSINIENSAKIEYDANAMLLNLFYDFCDLQRNYITPFIGAGVGIGSPNLKLVNYNSQDEQNITALAWQAQAGVFIRITANIILNLKYSLLSMPELDKSFIVNDNGNSEFLGGKAEKMMHNAGIGIYLFL